MKLDDNLLISHSEFLGVQDLIGKELPDFNCADPSFGFVFLGQRGLLLGKKIFLPLRKS